MSQAPTSDPPPSPRPSPSPGNGWVQLGVAGVVAGFALPVLYIAWLNRHGPGEVCQAGPEESSCVDAWSPWPFAGAALLLLLAAALLARFGLRAGQAAAAAGARLPSRWFGVAWVVVGATGLFGVVSLMTIGIFVLPAAVLLAIAVGLATARSAQSS